MIVSIISNMAGYFDKQSKRLLATQQPEPDQHFWRNKSLLFKSTSFPKVAETLKKYYDVDISFQNEAIKNCKLSAEFRGEAIEEILDMIALSHNLDVSFTDNNIMLNGEGCQ